MIEPLLIFQATGRLRIVTYLVIMASYHSMRIWTGLHQQCCVTIGTRLDANSTSLRPSPIKFMTTGWKSPTILDPTFPKNEFQIKKKWSWAMITSRPCFLFSTCRMSGMKPAIDTILARRSSLAIARCLRVTSRVLISNWR